MSSLIYYALWYLLYSDCGSLGHLPWHLEDLASSHNSATNLRKWTYLGNTHTWVTYKWTHLGKWTYFAEPHLWIRSSMLGHRSLVPPHVLSPPLPSNKKPDFLFWSLSTLLRRRCSQLPRQGLGLRCQWKWYERFLGSHPRRDRDIHDCWCENPK